MAEAMRGVAGNLGDAEGEMVLDHKLGGTRDQSASARKSARVDSVFALCLSVRSSQPAALACQLCASSPVCSVRCAE